MDSENELHSADELDSEAELEYAGALITFASALIVLGGAQQQRGVGRGNLGEDEEEHGEATPQPNVSGNSARQPSSTATKRRRVHASSSQGPSEEVYVRIVGALEELSSSFKDTIHRTNAFEEALNELTELGLDEVHLNTTVTLLAGNKGYERAFMFTRKDRRVGYVVGLLQSHGFL